MTRLRLGGVLIGLLGAAIAASAQWTGETVELRAPVDDDVYAAAGLVVVSTRVAGDVVAAGRELTIDGEILGDLMAAGEHVRLGGQVGDDARIAGGRVDVTGGVADHLVAAGGSLTVGPRAAIGRWAWLAGGRVDLAGRVGGPVRIAAGSVRIRGEVDGDLTVAGEEVVVVRGAHIRGDLVWQGPEAPRIASGARIDGQLLERPVPGPLPGGPGAGGGLLAAAAVTVAAVALYLIFPGVAVRAGAAARDAPWKSLGLGLAVLAATPLVMVALLATVVGALLALGLLAAYVLALLLGFLTGLYVVADTGLRIARRSEPGKPLRVLALALAVVALGVVQLVPVAGGVLMLLVLLSGLGALNLTAYRSYARAG